VFNTTFNNFSGISWQSVLVVGETSVKVDQILSDIGAVKSYSEFIKNILHSPVNYTNLSTLESKFHVLALTNEVLIARQDKTSVKMCSSFHQNKN
jgi:hypothetical protein